MGAAYIVLGFASIMHYVQLLHGLFLAPLFGTFLLGMFWRRTTPWGGFAGLVSGTVAGLVFYGLELAGVIQYGSPMAGNFWRAWWAWVVCFVATVAVSLVTRPKPEEELRGLVYGLTEKKEGVEHAWYKKPSVLAAAVLLITLALNIIFF